MSASLGARIAIGTVLSTALVVTIASTTAWYAAQRMLYESLDTKLRDRAHAFATRGVPVPLLLMQQHEGLPPEAGSTASWTLLQIVDAATRAEVTRSPSLPAELSLVDYLPAGALDQQVRAVELPDGRRLRLLATEAAVRPPSEHDHGHRWHGEGPPPAPAAPTIQGPLIVALALDATATADELRRLAWILEALSGGAIILAIAISAALRRAILRPVARLSEGIRALDASNLSARVASARTPRELDSVLQRLNELLGKVEQSVQRERTTIANIAHELRTPVAGLMTTLEFALADEHGPQAREVHTRCLAAVTQMRDLIRNLLALARLEAGQETWAPQPLDAVALMRESWEQLREESQRRRQLAAWIVPADALIASSPDKLRVILANVLGNAVDHAPDGVTIRIEAHLDRERGSLGLLVANPMRIPITDVDAVFRPFWRGDQSRAEGHTGLGLSLVQRLVRLLGGTVAAAIEGEAFVLRLELPARNA